jgi:hypothetical protein
MKLPRQAHVALLLLLAACAVFAGLDLHAMQFVAPTGATAAATGQAGLHGEGCSHRGHVPPVHDSHHCVHCKAGTARANGLPPAARVAAGSTRCIAAVVAQAPRAPAAQRHGTLGARGPPGTVG